MKAITDHQQYQYFTKLLASFPEWNEISGTAQSRILNTLDREIKKEASEPVMIRFANEIALSLHAAERVIIEKIMKKLQISQVVFEQIQHIISERSIQEQTVRLESRIDKDLGLDRLDLIWVILRCEQIFHIQIDEEAVIRPLATIQAYVTYISQLYFQEREFSTKTRFMNAS